METNATISKCISEYERLIALVRGNAKATDIDFWDHCEESTSTMLLELNDFLRSNLPDDLYKNIHDLNVLALRQIDSCEQRQRDNK